MARKKPTPANSRFQAYLELTKPRIMMLILVTTTLGYYLGGAGIHSIVHLALTLIGTALATGGAATLNHYLEREEDSLMERTRQRPLPAGIINASQALIFGLLLSLAGTVFLALIVNWLTAGLALLTIILYAGIYTPLKKLTWLNTSIGAIPGALPIVGGWTAATGSLDWSAWVLFIIMFLWQHPHFYAIAMMFRKDYEQAGFKMLPSVFSGEERTTLHILIHGIILIPVALLPTLIGLSGWIYFSGALVISLIYAWSGIPLQRNPSRVNARRVLLTSVMYLPILLILLITDSFLHSV